MKATATVPLPTGRFYKSRKSRPCDACRKRKVTCDMPTGPPCQRCKGKTVPCTFDHGPGERRRPTTVNRPRPLASSLLVPGDPRLHTPRESSHTQSMWFDSSEMIMYSDEEPLSLGRMSGHLAIEEHVFGTQASSAVLQEDMPFVAAVTGNLPYGSPRQELQTPATPTGSVSASSTASAPSIGSLSPTTQSTDTSSSLGSLEFHPGAFSFYIGPTGVSDVLLLSRQSFGDGGVAEPRVQGLRYRNMTLPKNPDAVRSLPVIFGLTDHALLDKAEPKPDPEATETAWSAFWRILNTKTAWSLLHLYTRFVDPYFPVLSKHQIPAQPDELSNMSLALLTAICATALPFVVYDSSLYELLLRPPSSEQLYRLCWLGISQELHAPSLATMQACLLLQQRLPANLYLNDTAFSWSLMATAVSVAQTIGLHREPSSWTDLPCWERRLRRRLWWALWSMEKWVALARGMPSHLAEDEADVELIRLDDTLDTMSSSGTFSDVSRTHLYYLVRLTTVLSEIQRSFYTLKATSRTANNLALSLEVGRSARVQLKGWRDSLPASLQFRSRQQEQASAVHNMDGEVSRDQQEKQQQQQQNHLDGNASLHLSYIVTHMTLFRALIRPLELDPTSSRNSCGTEALAVARGGLLCVREFVEFVESLTPVQWNAFWHSWSRANFSIAGSFMVQLLLVLSEGGNRRNRRAEESEGTEVILAAPESPGFHTTPPDKRRIEPAPRARAGFEDEYGQLLGWIKRWRWASRVSSTGVAGAKGLTNLGLLRFETFMRQFGDLGESI